MRAPDGTGRDGTDDPCQEEYLEIISNQRLVLTNIATYAAGKPILDGLTPVTFAEANGNTKLTVDTRATATPLLCSPVPARNERRLDAEPRVLDAEAAAQP